LLKFCDHPQESRARFKVALKLGLSWCIHRLLDQLYESLVSLVI
jgi:hypothetical protein